MEPKDQNYSDNITSSSVNSPDSFSERLHGSGQGSVKKNKKTTIAIVSLAVVAIAGIGFSIYGFLQNSQKNSERENLKAEIIDKDETIARLQNNSTIDGSDLNTSVKIAGPYIENGYFFVPAWSLKFKIPSDLANYGYSVDYDEAQSGYTLPTIGFTAMLKSDIAEGAQARYYDDIGTCAIVSVSKENSWDEKRVINGIIKKFDDYSLLIWNYNRHDSCDYKLHIDEVQTKIQNMFSNPENI